MTLEQFSKVAGMEITNCDPECWGGAFGYTTKDHPNCENCGYESKELATIAWLENTFGQKAATAILSILEKEISENV